MPPLTGLAVSPWWRGRHSLCLLNPHGHRHVTNQCVLYAFLSTRYECQSVSQRLGTNVLIPFSDRSQNLGIVGDVEHSNAVFDFEIGVFAQLLHLPDEVAGHSFAL